MDTASKVRDSKVITTSDFKWTDRCVALAQKVKSELFRMKSTFFFLNSEVFKPMHKAVVRQPEYCFQAWFVLLKTEPASTVQVHQAAARMIGEYGRKP